MLGTVRSRVPRMGSHQRPDIGLLIRRNNTSSLIDGVCAVAAGRSDIHGRKRFSTQSSSFLEILPATRSSPPPWWWTASLTISALAAAGSTLLNRDSRAQCETETQSDPVTPPLKAAAAADDEEEDDPYAILPDEDEETACSFCNTFRQGPCRPYWRKLERCFKDNEKKENGDGKCVRYYMPHQDCVMEYTNLYILVSLALNQDLVRDAELSVSKHEWRTWDPAVDWSIWKQFVGEVGLSYKQTVRRWTDESKHELLPLWKRLPENTEPVLLTVPVPLPKVDEKSGMILKIAYAVDQDGFVLGLTYNNEYGELLEQAEGKGKSSESQHDETKDSKLSSTDSGSERKSSDESDGTFKFDFHVLPGETKSVRVCGLYAENPVTASPDKTILDSLLFKSGKHVLKRIVKKPKS